MKTSEKNYYVYRHIRPDNGIVFYVGKGSGARKDAIYNRNRYWRAIHAKHGVVSEIIEDNLTEEESFSREVFWIAHYKALGQCSCNFTDGGDGVRVKNRWWGRKISASLLGRPSKSGMESGNYKDFATTSDLVAEYAKHGIVLISRKYGVSTTTIQSRLISAGVKLRSFSQKPKSVVCLDDGIVYPSVKSAASAYGCLGTNIAKVIKGKHKTASGRKFAYVNNEH